MQKAQGKPRYNKAKCVFIFLSSAGYNPEGRC